MKKKDISMELILDNIRSIDNAAHYLRGVQSAMSSAKQDSLISDIHNHIDKVLTRIEHSNKNIELLISS